MTEPTSDLTAGSATCRYCRSRVTFLRGVGWVHSGDVSDYDVTHEASPAMSWNIGEPGFSATCTGMTVSGGHVAHIGPCPLCGESGR